MPTTRTPERTRPSRAPSRPRPRSTGEAARKGEPTVGSAGAGDVRVEGDLVVRRAEGAASEPPPPAAGARRAAKPAKPARRVFTARTADRHELYQLSVQSPEDDVRFLQRVYRTLRKRPAHHFREDFCGTALLSATWVRRGEDFTAEGFDIDPDPLAWGIAHNFEPLGEGAKRATLHLKDVRRPSLRRPDVRCAQNFSWFVFKQRAELLGYLRAAHEDLADDGVLVLDIYGGPESMEEMEELRKIPEGFTYVWDQVSYSPVTGDYKAHIHFRFRDGSQIRRAFSYDWRLWTLTEVQDALREAGFGQIETYWEGTDDDGESGNGVYRRSKKGENCLAWVTYVVAAK